MRKRIGSQSSCSLPTRPFSVFTWTKHSDLEATQTRQEPVVMTAATQEPVDSLQGKGCSSPRGVTVSAYKNLSSAHSELIEQKETWASAGCACKSLERRRMIERRKGWCMSGLRRLKPVSLSLSLSLMDRVADTSSTCWAAGSQCGLNSPLGCLVSKALNRTIHTCTLWFTIGTLDWLSRDDLLYAFCTSCVRLNQSIDITQVNSFRCQEVEGSHEAL